MNLWGFVEGRGFCVNVEIFTRVYVIASSEIGDVLFSNSNQLPIYLNVDTSDVGLLQSCKPES